MPTKEHAHVVNKINAHVASIHRSTGLLFSPVVVVPDRVCLFFPDAFPELAVRALLQLIQNLSSNPDAVEQGCNETKLLEVLVCSWCATGC